MIKDRYPEFKENVEKYDTFEDISIINHFAVVDMEEPFMKEFFDKIDLLQYIINEIRELADHIEYLRSASLASPLDSNIKTKLEEKAVEIRQISTEVRKILREIKHIQDTENDSGTNSIRNRIIDAHVNEMTRFFCDIINKYYESEIIYRERCRTRIARQLEIVGLKKDENQIEKFLQNDQQIFNLQIMINVEQSEQILKNMEDRHCDIIKIEGHIRELHDVCMELATLTELQGIQITSIEQYALAAAAQIEKTRLIIDDSINYKRSAKKLCRKRKFVSLLVLPLWKLFTSCI